MPAGFEVTVPMPVLVTVRLWSWVNVAITALAMVIASLHGSVPLQAPDQPVNAQPAAGIAVRVIMAPSTRLALQVAPQSIAAGAETTVPEPSLVTISSKLRLKVADTVFLDESTTT